MWGDKVIKTTKGEQSKIKLIECAAQLFLEKGYNATGINDILAGTGLPKGSFYFHFSSKKDLAIEVSKYFEKKFTGWLTSKSVGANWNEFITAVTEDMIMGAENKKHFGCPFAVLGLEIAFSDIDISEHYYNSLNKLIALFASVFKFSGIPEDKINILSTRAFAIYEGYLVYYRIGKDVNTIKMMQQDLIKIYEEYKVVK